MIRPRPSVSALLLLALPLGLAGCPKGGGGGTADPCTDFPGVCLDLSAWVDDQGTGAAARQAESADLLTGEAAQGRAGDWLLANDRVRVIVQGQDRHMGPAPYGGNIIDADLVRPDGEPGREAFGELSLLLNFGRTLKVSDVRVWRDGSDGGPAVLAVTGHDVVNDFINVPVLLEKALPGVGHLWMDPNEDLGLTITEFFILKPGEQRVRIVTALRNDSEADHLLAVGELIDRGGAVSLFNPSRTMGNPFGYVDMLPEPANDYLGYAGRDVAYAYVPVGVPGREDDPNLSLTVSGVTGLVIGADDLFAFTGAEIPSRPPPGAVRLAPGAVHTVVRDFWVGKDLADVVAGWDGDRGTDLGAVHGTVSIEGEALPPETRVAALGADGKPYAVFYVEDGAFSGRLPAGPWTLVADAPGHPFSASAEVEIAAGADVDAPLALPPAAEVTVRVRTPAGAPVPAKVTFVCEGACPKDLPGAGSRFRDTRYDPFPSDVQLVDFVGASGDATFRVPPGTYDLVVSRGSEWSTFPAGWPEEAHPLELGAGPTTVDAEIAPVVSSPGWVTADLHVHAINSPDSPVTNLDRVRTFLGEGVDVIVATDHDFVTDYRPIIREADAEGLLATVTGQEMTTFTWGHFNAFPFEPEPQDLNGGAVDWGGGDGPSLTPAQLFAAARDRAGPADRVVQVNHPRGTLGYFSAIGLDTATGATTTDPALFRMPEDGVRPGDTGLFSPDFTAMEIFNGFDTKAFATRTRDWFAFLQRGLTVTATAVSDTHKWYSEGVGNPHSWVRVGAGVDTAATFDEPAFVAGINGGRLVGGNGPFVTLAASDGTSTADVGEVLSTAQGTPVTLTVTVETPTWLRWDTLELYSNVEGTDSRSGEEGTELPAPDDSVSVDLSAEPTVPGAFEGAATDTVHRRHVVTRTFTVTPSEDRWYVVMVRGHESAFPVILERSVGALAFTNPVYVDVDGNGAYDAPHTFGEPSGKPAVAPRGTPRRLDAQDLERIKKAVLHHGR